MSHSELQSGLLEALSRSPEEGAESMVRLLERRTDGLRDPDAELAAAVLSLSLDGVERTPTP